MVPDGFWALGPLPAMADATAVPEAGESRLTFPNEGPLVTRPPNPATAGSTPWATIATVTPRPLVILQAPRSSRTSWPDAAAPKPAPAGRAAGAAAGRAFTGRAPTAPAAGGAASALRPARHPAATAATRALSM
jgi:hypothetical protein